MFQLFGPVKFTVQGSRVDLGPAKQRTVLAALLTDAGRLVTWSALVDRVWDQAPTTDARNVLYTYVNRIRRLLERAHAAGGPEAALVRRTGGYVLEVEPDRVDLHRFRRLVSTAHDQRCSDADRSRLLREALDLWDGAALADLPGAWAARTRETWNRQRLDAVAYWARAELRLGRHDEVIGPVRELVAEHPFAEPLVAVLMRALVAAGWDAEALDCYATTRARLVGRFGAEPGPELREVHEMILRRDRDRATRVRRAPSAARPVPAQLPADVPTFVGREHELSRLSDHLAGTGRTTMVTYTVSGTAGVGKSALAVRWAHRVRDAFPDGQLYVNLRGHDLEQPVAAAAALAGFLSALGVAEQDVPPEVNERAARYRTEISGRRMLILLDNALSVEQVRPLLPGTPSCVVMVTSRDSLAGLVALHGAHRLELDLLPVADATALLSALIGGPAEADSEATSVLAGQCARLPLALRVVAELATARPAISLTELAGKLADRRRRLDLLDAGGDPRAAVRAVFSRSYARLPADAARMFRLLGLHPASDLDLPAAAALTGEPPERAHRLLDLLARAHLIQPASTGRYGMHDLLRAYAADLAHAEDSRQERHEALTRLLDHDLTTSPAEPDILLSPK
ncbi:DNA-binding SARP family transcriptional activator [Streptosporangium album]|uniref:DNA-binding SARP family transcriptional activator n=1 Tax=Streptosporangium album TaxID=47479 RepID=A0A7W7S4R8_9ACTN|nr:AfsR/SARP family transcriptional regulator [Streptosporangium album]MBB4943881.1 DNA-binding SARP family transcriptional activator [Streptosporangium album]